MKEDIFSININMRRHPHMTVAFYRINHTLNSTRGENHNEREYFSYWCSS